MMYGHLVPTGGPFLLCRSCNVFSGSVMLPQWTKKIVSDLPVVRSSFHAVELSGSTIAVASKPALLHVRREGHHDWIVCTVVAELRQLLAVYRVVDGDADIGVVPGRFRIVEGEDVAAPIGCAPDRTLLVPRFEALVPRTGSLK